MSTGHTASGLTYEPGGARGRGGQGGRGQLGGGGGALPAHRVGESGALVHLLFARLTPDTHTHTHRGQFNVNTTVHLTHTHTHSLISTPPYK